MVIPFSPDLVLPHDPAGFGLWRTGHYLEHRLFITQALTLVPAVNIPDYDLQSWSDNPTVVASFLNSHAQIHNALRAPANYSGVDLSAVDLTDDEQWSDWMETHRTEHQFLRQFYGVN